MVGCLISVPLGLAFYLWLGVYNMFVISNFWSFANDVYTPDQGKRLFPIIGVGGVMSGADARAKIAAGADLVCGSGHMRLGGPLVSAFLKALPFRLTGAQTRALKEIFAEMTSPQRMNRWLQGDVGSGKTVVALFAKLLAAENGYQAALMAPTEILATQHFIGITELAQSLNLNIKLLTVCEYTNDGDNYYADKYQIADGG